MAEDHHHHHPDFVVGIAQGARWTRAHQLHSDGECVPMFSVGHRDAGLRPGCVEHDPAELLDAMNQCLDYAGGAEGVALAFDSGMVIAWDAETGAPLHNAIGPGDRRGAALVADLTASDAATWMRARTGQPLDAGLPAARLRWLLDHAPDARALAASGRLRLGTWGSYVCARLAGVCAMDVSAAARTGLMNLTTGQWDPEVCDLFGVPPDLLPGIRPSVADFGVLPGARAPVVASVADRSAALFGHGCHAAGQLAVSLEPDGQVLAAAGSSPPADAVDGLLRTVAWRIGAVTTCAVCATLGAAPAALDWARNLGLFQSPRDLAHFEGASALERGIVFVPGLAGLDGPHGDASATGLWIGMGPATSRTDLLRAVLEGIALRTAQVVAAIGEALQLAPTVSLEGAPARSGYFCDFLARALDRTVIVPASPDPTGLGCAQLAFIGAGLGPLETLPPVPPPDRNATPARPLDAAALARFADAAGRAGGWRTARAASGNAPARDTQEHAT
jgi:glycerol kinase